MTNHRHRLPRHRPDPLRNHGQALELPNAAVGLAQLAGRDHVLMAATAVAAPASERRAQVRITLGTMSSSRLSSATVFSPVRMRWTVVRLNSALDTRRPSGFRG